MQGTSERNDVSSGMELEDIYHPYMIQHDFQLHTNETTNELNLKSSPY